MNVEADRATFTWSEGPASFEPYTLDGMVYKDFKEIAEEAREKLADLVKDYLFDEANMPKSAFALAEAGHELYQAMFQPGAEQARQAKQVRKWLAKLREQHEVDTLEIVVESPWSLPWNILYDQEPDEEDFLVNDDSSDHWKPFWGLRYNLAGGRKVDPMRRMPLLSDPKVLMVVDPEIRDGLPEEQQQRLADFVGKHNFTMVHSKDELQKAIKTQRPDFLYWLSHAAPDELVLAGEPISPRNMRKLLRQDDDENFGGLAFLNACQTAESGETGSFFEAFHSVGFAGMIGTEHQTVDQFANPLGLDFLEAFLDRGEPVGSTLRKLRGRVPLGLLYGTYCPPDIRVDCGKASDNMEIEQVHVGGVALSAGLSQQTAARPLPPLPDEPYRSLAYFERGDRALFAGRDDDIERFATMLDDSSTRILVLHGESGVGKSSFLHAGVIPYLEEECLGYRFIRNWEQDDNNQRQGSVLFVRATNDLFGQLAAVLCDFCAQPYEYQTPLGNAVSADLPGVLDEVIGNEVNQATVRAVLRSDPALIGQILSAISDRLPFAAILVIDQGEEVFTLAQTPEDQQRGRQALDMLRRTVGAAGDFKVIFCLRTEYYGRVIDRLRRGLQDAGSIREYLLTDFDEVDLLEAIRRPTAAEAIPYTSDVPFKKYGFRFADGVAEEIARRVVRYTTQRRDSVLPMVQVICAQLYRLARQRDDGTITIAALETLGGIEGGMRSHVEGLLDELLKDSPSDKKPLQKLFTQLYLQQPDGTRTTALLPEDAVKNRWTGRVPFDELLESCRKLRLLKVNNLRIGMELERRYISLGHDSLAKLAAAWDEELTRSERLRRKLKKALAWASGAAAILVVISVVALWMHRVNEEKLAQQGVDGVMLAPPAAISYAIDILRPRKQHALTDLQKRIVDPNYPLPQRLHAACALAEFLPMSLKQHAPFLLECIATPEIEADESFNLVKALDNDREFAVDLLRVGLKNENAPAMKVRWAMTLLSLGEELHVRQMLKSQGDPVKRTLFLKHFRSWPGDLSVVRGLLESEHEIDSDFRSGLCAALGRLEKKLVPKQVADALTKTLLHLHRHAGDGATHSAAFWALNQWKVEVPAINQRTEAADGFHWYTNTLGMTMLHIPDGSFRMGSEVKMNERPIHTVRVESFYLCNREVTHRQFAMWLQDEAEANSEKAEESDGKSADKPVQTVNWIEAVRFCNWVSRKENLVPCYEQKDAEGQWQLITTANGYRLPSEAEWEYACRAGTTTKYSCGDDDADLPDYGVFDYQESTELCASKPPNAWGLFDMHGNVFEWCADVYFENYDSKSVTDQSVHVYRGGSFQSDAGDVRSAARDSQGHVENSQFGLRVARNRQ